MKGLRLNVRSREVSDLQRCPLVQVLLYMCSERLSGGATCIIGKIIAKV